MVSRRNFPGSVSAASLACLVKESLALPASFQHTHLSGTGCIDMLDVLLMPATDDFKFDPQAKPDSAASYRSKFSHAEEQAVPGYYSVFLQGSRVKAELTATERVRIHLTIEAKRQFPKPMYVRSVEWNGSPIKGLTVEHAQLIKVGTLIFHLGDEPTGLS